ncbi:DUF1801 domain-containing protein [uncultured Paludibaculum sp.]|uniref:DUF1801 domain-containing protein n=1 Tax=uncultured Paludibaculum sp. TaxID=1765020 RepID=UPI002AAA7ED5|nr:DUF1801 domain-containing protein [uncultured Paludibaculum sp.]
MKRDSKPPAAVQPDAVEAWAARLDPWQREIFEALCSLVAEEAPSATRLIKWGHPIWDHGGPFVLFKPASRHVTLGFWHGPSLPDPAGLLEGEGGSVRHVKLSALSDLAKFPVRQWIRAAVKFNAEVGDASKRK